MVRGWWRKGLGRSLVGVMCLHSTLPVAWAEVSRGPDSLQARSVEGVPNNSVSVAHVRLQEDGVLAGRLSLHYATGKSQPAQAVVTFAQGEQILQSSPTDSTGYFTLAGLQPGEYAATATVGERSARFAVRLLEFDPDAVPGEMLLQGTLNAAAEGESTEDLVFVEEAVPACGDCGECDLCTEEVVEETVVEEECLTECAMGVPCGSGGFSGGGCCGGGGFGGAGLLGLAGLAAGITALATDDGGGPPQPASPTAP